MTESNVWRLYSRSCASRHMPCRSLRLSIVVAAGLVILLSFAGVGHLTATNRIAQTLAVTAAPGVATPESSFNTPIQLVPDVSARHELVLPDVARLVTSLERKGLGRKIISMSLFGADPRYTVNAVYNAMIVQKDWQGWTLRVYYGQNVPIPVVDLLTAFGAETVAALEFKPDYSTFWRFFALEDRSATRVIMRDADARLSERDRLAVQEWMASDWPVHIMHDHHFHSATILAGMWGAVPGFLHPKLFDQWRLPNSSKIAGAAETATYGADQDWLASHLWPLIRNATLNHASYYCGKFGEAEWRPFPSLRRNNLDIVGQVYSIKSNYNGDFTEQVCPVACRQPHAADC